jgi:hypothetical protein
MSMQINRSNSSLFVPATSAAADSATDAGDPAKVATKTACARVGDLSSMTLQKQLELGKDMGVFTKISFSKDSLKLAKLDPAPGLKSAAFVASAVTTMKDYEEGFAVLKENSGDASAKTGNFLAAKFRDLQNLAGKLNVFA